jgi:hypothetical protein
MEFILSNILFQFELFLEKKLLIKMNNVKIEKKIYIMMGKVERSYS